MTASLRLAVLVALALGPALATAGAQELVRVVKAPIEQERWINLKDDRELLFSVQVPGLQRLDEVKIRAELGVTNDVATRTKQKGSELYKGEHRYDLRVAGEAHLGATASVSGGRYLGGDATKVTPQNHHGLLVVSVDAAVKQSDAGSDVVNLLVRSRVPGAPEPQNAIKLSYPGAISPPGGRALTRVDRGKGHLHVLVLASGWQSAWTLTGLATTPGQVLDKSIEEQERTVAITLPLGAVRRGEVFDVMARLHLTSANNGRPQLASGQFLITDGPTKTSGRRVSGHHGFNVPAGQTAVLRKVAAFTADRDYPQAWLNLVVNSNAKALAQKRRLRIDASRSEISGFRYTRNAP
jgi:hypothetical protein